MEFLITQEGVIWGFESGHKIMFVLCHQVKKEGNENISYCAKESGWSRFSKCIAQKALTRFLEQESLCQSTCDFRLAPHT